MKKRRKKSSNVVLGGEPTWNPQKDENQIISLLNWYSYHKSWDDGIRYLFDYWKHIGKPSKSLKIIKRNSKWDYNITLGFVGRIIMMAQEVPTPEDYKNRIEDEYLRLFEMGDKLKPEPIKDSTKKKRVSVKEAMEVQIGNYIAELDGELDSFMENNFTSEWNPDEWFKEKELKLPQTKEVLKYINKQLRDYQLLYKGDDKELEEAYNHLKKSHVRKLKKFFEKIQKAGENWKKTAVAIKDIERKPSRRTRSPLKQTENLSYQKECQELSIKSIPPTRMVGATQLITYNTKTKILGFYCCTNNHGFSVKGTTLFNFDLSKSMGKTVRKPNDVIPKLIDIKRSDFKEIFSNLTTKEKPLNGRFNKDTLIIGVM